MFKIPCKKYLSGSEKRKRKKKKLKEAHESCQILHLPIKNVYVGGLSQFLP
jgi:hypothetical protein